MKIEVYTKVVLTGIFLCLCLLLLRDVRFEKQAFAELRGQIPTKFTVRLELRENAVDLDD